ncbi:MAG: superoxide dismutase [Cu-Zn] SodC [Paraperlucidibaca sp.]
MTLTRTLIASALLLATSTAIAGKPADIVVAMQQVTDAGVADSIGTITLSHSRYGTVITPDLTGLTPGLHGFHMHTNPSCDAAEKDGKMVPGLAAAGHFDPNKTGTHGTPWGNGHLGDLPPLFVDSDGRATQPVLAPRLTLKRMREHSLMMHAGGDNHHDHPMSLGGGGARMACGVVK